LSEYTENIVDDGFSNVSDDDKMWLIQMLVNKHIYHNVNKEVEVSKVTYKKETVVFLDVSLVKSKIKVTRYVVPVKKGWVIGTVIKEATIGLGLKLSKMNEHVISKANALYERVDNDKSMRATVYFYENYYSDECEKVVELSVKLAGKRALEVHVNFKCTQPDYIISEKFDIVEKALDENIYKLILQLLNNGGRSLFMDEVDAIDINKNYITYTAILLRFGGVVDILYKDTLEKVTCKKEIEGVRSKLNAVCIL